MGTGSMAVVASVPATAAADAGGASLLPIKVVRDMRGSAAMRSSAPLQKLKFER